MSELEPKYDPKSVESELYSKWEKAGVFSADADSQKPAYTIIMPPPNVTGVLHMGHALMATLEDILTRRKRMQGFNTLWLPGTDHAGIATQMVVERTLLKEEGKTKHDLGRDEFLKRVWEWKERSQGTILSQLRRIGSSCDWNRICFTLDEGPIKAVRECFKRLFDEDLIYRKQAMIQWCPRCRTALSDLEVKFEERKGHLWEIKYLLKDDPSQALIVATTRPETLFGDAAVAVNPNDDRFKAFHGKKVILPLLKKELNVIQDEYVDMEFGTGALKITPAHDPNDYEIGLKHKLAEVNIFDETAHLNEAAGPYKGQSREEARKNVVADLEAQGLLIKEEKYKNNVGTCDRCKTLVEPRVSKQWFVNAEELAREAIRVVEDKEIKIVPEEWEKTYFNWMRNIRPWCISRQLWWGHRIPIWYCADCNEVSSHVEDPKGCPKCQSSRLTQDEDVLDTWFSSGLWPLSTLGWPNKTKDLDKFYPSDCMETGFDILFFWVARMIMMGLKMHGEIPFKTIYLHPMVRDEYGQKMSKTKGNVKDPLDIISTTGADSLRYYFCAHTFHGQDIRVTDSGLEGARNFVNKLWNVSRFVLMHFSDVKKENLDLANPINQWIWTSLNETKAELNRCFEEYRFFDAARILYQFVWETYCSWFVEFIKSEEELESRKTKKESTAIQVLEEILRLAHPIMPFVTEEIWQKLPLREDGDWLATASYPESEDSKLFPEAKKSVDRVTEIIDGIRTYRGTSGINPGKEIGIVVCASAQKVEELKNFGPLIQKLARGKDITFSDSSEFDTKSHVLIALPDTKVYLPKADLGDLTEQTEKMRKELEGMEKAFKTASAKLKNDNFTANAPKEVVEGVRSKKEELSNKIAHLKKHLGDN